MDAERFDAISRTFSRGFTRRRLTRLLGGLSLGGVLSAGTIREAAAAPLNGGSACDTDSDCKTGTCLGSGKCSCSRDFPTCKQPANRCKQATCDVAINRCVITDKARGATCPGDGNPCTRDICNGSGACIHPNKKDGLSCDDGTCQGGLCTPDVCEPQCGGKQCGPDGCDGSCGTCHAVERCSADQQCVCDAPGPGDICTSAEECCAYTPDRTCDRGDGPCSSIFKVCHYGLGGPCGGSCDCRGDLVCSNGTCRCPDGRVYLSDARCCGVGLVACDANLCCRSGECFCFPGIPCRCRNPF